MPLGPLGVTGALAALDWGAWEWATSANHPTLGLIAGLLMAPLAVAFAWSLVRVLVALARIGLKHASSEARSAAARPAGPAVHTPFDIEEQDERIAA